MTNAKVLTGLEVLKREQFARLQGLRVGLLTNASSVDSNYSHIVELMSDCGVNLTTLFGPEHGLFTASQDMIAIEGERHRLRIVSLYGKTFESLKPSEEDLRDLDILVFDIQGIGSRYYTYIWSLALSMETAARTGTRVMVLDRPNPITASTVEGGGIEESLRSFVGYYELPNRHGMTLGEIAGLISRTLEKVPLEVVKMEGYRRSMWFDETGAPWVLPSPNMPTLETALMYPGQCLLEGTNLSEGRGTTRPFEIFGAPYIDGRKLARALEEENLPGARFRPLWFRPTFQKWAGRICGGLQIHVVDRDAYQPYRTSLAVLRHTRALWPKEFQWRREAYEFRNDVPAIDLLTGQARVRDLIDAGAPTEEIAAYAELSGERARKNRLSSLLYQE